VGGGSEEEARRQGDIEMGRGEEDTRRGKEERKSRNMTRLFSSPPPTLLTK